ncbi:MAG TPA: flippase-like domain-containing protein [Thermoplasmatales archaeon]|nr:flippase-like domain-containing protein [Thermoplasmatales archaeon]
MTTKGRKQKTVKLSIIISVTLSIAIILAILYLTIDADTFEKLRTVKIRYEFFILAIFLNILYWFLWGARLKILANAIDPNVKISFWKSTKIVIANLFLAGITPSMAGGEPVRIYLLNKEGMSIGGSTATVLGERLIDAFFILLVAPFGFFIYKDKLSSEYLSSGLWIGVIVFILLIILFIFAILKPEKVKSFLIYLNKKLNRILKKQESESKIIKTIGDEVDNFHNSMTCFVGERKKALFIAGILTVLFWSTGFMIPSMIFLGLGLPPFFIESYAAQILLLVIIMMPTTPGSTGVAELSIAGLYGVLIGSTLLGVFIVLYRFISYHMNLIAGVIFQYRIFRSVASFSMDMIKKDKGE